MNTHLFSYQKRKEYENTCKKKKPFESMVDAYRTIVYQKDKFQDEREKRVYKCQFCGKHHITTQEPRPIADNLVIKKLKQQGFTESDALRYLNMGQQST